MSLLELARYEKTPLPETGAGLPLLTLAEVEGAGYRRAAEAAPNVRDDVNQLVQTWTPGAPLGLSAWEAGYADGTQDTVYLVQRYCRLSGAGGAKAFGRGLARRLWLLEPEEYTVLKETPDTLVLANYEDGPGFHQTLLLVVDGPDVLFLHYWGGGARSAMWAPRRRRGLRNIRPRRAGGEPPQPTKAPGLSCAFRRILIY